MVPEKSSTVLKYASHAPPARYDPRTALAPRSPTRARRHRVAPDRNFRRIPTHRIRTPRPQRQHASRRELLQHTHRPAHSTNGTHARRAAHARHCFSTTRKGSRAHTAQDHAHRTRPQPTITRQSAGWPRTAHRATPTPHTAARHNATPTRTHIHIHATHTDKSDGSIVRSKQRGSAP